MLTAVDQSINMLIDRGEHVLSPAVARLPTLVYACVCEAGAGDLNCRLSPAPVLFAEKRVLYV